MKVLVDPPIEHGFEISSMALLFGIVLVSKLKYMLLNINHITLPNISYDYSRYLLLACSRIDGDAKKRWWLVVWASGYLDLS
jgi:hypothetical protein